MSDHFKQLEALFNRLPKDLARQAFSHSSWADERSHAYERLAFLGDSVLNLALSTALFPRFAHHGAGRLTKIRAQAVSRRSCVEVAHALDVPGRMLRLAPDGHEQQVESLTSAGSVLAEGLEAGIGACLLEFGFDETAEAVAGAFGPPVELAIAHLSDFKSELQERLAQRGETVDYRVADEHGPPHDRRFETVAEVDGRSIGSGSGRSKKESEQEAAREALEKMDEE